MTEVTTASRKRASSTDAGVVRKNGLATAAPAARKGAIAPALSREPAPAPVPLPASPKVKQKLVRDSFTIPKPEYAVLDALKLRAANLMRPTKKSEVLRAGIFALNAMNDRAFLAALNSVPSLKTGRPKNPPAVTSPLPGAVSE